MRQWTPRRWNDVLAILILVLLPAYWWLGQPSDTIVGTTLAGWLLVVQFFFRKTPSRGADDG